MSGDNPAGLLRAVCVLDPAIDRVKTDVAAYAESRDPDLVHILPGLAPRWVTLRPLSVGEVAFVDAAGTGAVAALHAFRCAVVRIENFDRPGLALEPTHPGARTPDGEIKRTWGEAETDLVLRTLGFGFIAEIGKLAYDRAFAGNAWSGSVPFTLPQSSTQGLDLIARRLVALERAASATRSSETSAGGSTPTPPPNSGAGTDAAATGGTDSPAAAP